MVVSSRAAAASRGAMNARVTIRGKDIGNHLKRNSKDSNLVPETAAGKRGSIQEHSAAVHHVGPDRALFVDVQEMKQKIKENMHKPKYNVTDLYHEKGWVQAVARHPCFDQIGLAIIGLNALWIAIDTDYNKHEALHEAQPIFQIVENFFCSFFLVEWIVRFCAFKLKMDCLKDAWFIFDGCLVVLMVLETWVLTVVLKVTGIKTSSGFANASILRLVRLLRLTRMARMARLLRAVPELMILIKGIVTATRSVFFTLCLLVSVIYVFGIAFVQLTRDTYVGRKYFDTVALSMFTLLLRGTYLDEITELMDEVRQESVFLVILFLAFVLLAAQTVTNMLIGVLCEVVSIVAATEKEEMMMTFVISKMSEILNVLDHDKDHHISKKEFVQMLTNQEATRTLHEVGVDAVSLVDFADVIFASEDGQETSLSFLEFMDIVLQYRGSNTATVKDVVESQKIVRNGLRALSQKLMNLEVGLRSSGVIRHSRYRGVSCYPLLNNNDFDDDDDDIDKGLSFNVKARYSELSCQNRHSMQSDATFQSRHSVVSSAASDISNFNPGASQTMVSFAKQDSHADSEASHSSGADNKDIDADAKTNFLDSLQSQMAAIQRSVTQGHATLHQIVSQQLEHELQLRLSAERDAAKFQSQASSLQEENCQLRDLLGTVRPDVSEEQIKIISPKKNNHLQVNGQQEATHKFNRNSQLAVKTDTAADTLQKEEIAGPRPPWRPSSASSLRSTASHRKRQAIADSPDDDRLEFFSAPIDAVSGGLSQNFLPEEFAVPGQMQTIRPLPSSAVPRPADVVAPEPPNTPAVALPLRASDRERRGQQLTDSERRGQQYSNFRRDADNE